MPTVREQRSVLARFTLTTVLLLAGLAAAAIPLHGYHFGFDDQSVYLPAVKKALNPALYPYDADFFLQQTRLGIFEDVVAASVRSTGLSIQWTFFLLYFAATFLLLAGCWRIARYCFRTTAGICGSLLLVTVLLTLPAAGTFVVISDPYLHSRAVATAFLLFAFADVLERRVSAAVWAALALLIHPTLALIGLWHVIVQAWPSRDTPARPAHGKPEPVAAAIAAALPAPLAPPLAQWLADPNFQPWREAVSGNRYLFPGRWTWYETLGAFAPLLILFGFSRVARRFALPDAARICRRLTVSGSVGVAAGWIVGTVPALLPLVPLEPLRTLHLLYLMMVLVAGGLCGELLAPRWKAFAAVLLLPLAFLMFSAQRDELTDSPHVEWPGRLPDNDWRRAFEWVRMNTPRDALFAINPYLLNLPAEDEHGFRGLAERGHLADARKDRAVSRNRPALAWAWQDQVRAQTGIDGFDYSAFAELRERYGATWVLLWKGAENYAGGKGLDCPYENATAKVCRLP